MKTNLVKAKGDSCKMRNDELCLFVDVIENPVKVSIRDSPPSDFFKTVEEINRAVVTFSNPHVLYKGMVYCKPKDASFTFVEMMDPESYLNKLLASEMLREQVMRHMNALLRVMSNPQREVLPQIKLILISSKLIAVIVSKFQRENLCHARLALRTLEKYHQERLWHKIHSTPPEPKYFKDGILNSFLDLNERIQFFNKYYQCLMAHRMPYKIRKLVVWGPKDSGKTSWFNVFLGLIPMKFIASITNGKQFSAAMISDETQLVFLDE